MNIFVSRHSASALNDTDYRTEAFDIALGKSNGITFN